MRGEATVVTAKEQGGAVITFFFSSAFFSCVGECVVLLCGVREYEVVLEVINTKIVEVFERENAHDHVQRLNLAFMKIYV